MSKYAGGGTETILEGPSKEQERTHSNKAVSAVALHEAVRRGIVLCLDITLLRGSHGPDNNMVNQTFLRYARVNPILRLDSRMACDQMTTGSLAICYS